MYKINIPLFLCMLLAAYSIFYMRAAAVKARVKARESFPYPTPSPKAEEEHLPNPRCTPQCPKCKGEGGMDIIGHENKTETLFCSDCGYTQ